MIYSIPYVTLIIFLGTLAYLTEKKQEDKEFCTKLIYLGFGVFFVFFAFRGYIFHDWRNYYNEFENLRFYNFVNYEFGDIKSHEPGWILFNLICKAIIDDYHFMIFMLTLIETLLLSNFLKKYSSNILLSLTIMLVFEGFATICNLLRNLPSMLVFLNIIPYIAKKSPIKYFLGCIIAISIHFSSIIFVPLYFILNRDTNKYIYISIVAICNVIFVIHFPIVTGLIKLLHIGGDFLETKLDVYSEIAGSRGIGLGYVERLLTSVLIFCYYDKLKKLKEYNKIFINTFILYIITFSILNEFDEIAKRFSTLFIYAYWIIWPELIKCFYYKNNKKLFASFLGIYCIIKIIATVNFPLAEYQNILLGNDKSYQEQKYLFDKTVDVK